METAASSEGTLALRGQRVTATARAPPQEEPPQTCTRGLAARGPDSGPRHVTRSFLYVRQGHLLAPARKQKGCSSRSTCSATSLLRAAGGGMRQPRGDAISRTDDAQTNARAPPLSAAQARSRGMPPSELSRQPPPRGDRTGLNKPALTTPSRRTRTHNRLFHCAHSTTHCRFQQ